MGAQITFIRHGETEANATDVWQGQGDSPLSAIGRTQAKALGTRIDGGMFDRVISSDLGRVLETADLAGIDVAPDPAWREVDIGRWEGLTRDEVMAIYPDDMAALARGENPTMGGGESWPSFHERIGRSFADLLSTVSDGERLAVFAHGGVIHAILRRTLGFSGTFPWPIERVHNTAITRLQVDGASSAVEVFNDASHNDFALHHTSEGSLVSLVRHGQSEGNVAGIWQGRSESLLTDLGREQAKGLADWHTRPSVVVTSPTGRAATTAAVLAETAGVDTEVHEGLVEIDFGEWEGLGPAEARGQNPELFEATYGQGNDLPRGRTGETYAAAGERVKAAVTDIAERHASGYPVAFGHGGSIRSFAAGVLGLDYATRSRLMLPGNARSSTVRIGPEGFVLVDYNLRA